MHNQAVFLVLRRMRAPLLLLIVIYAVTVGGLVLMPGVDPDGNPHRLSFFHAFYVITYTATTTGFGELPFPFTNAHRLWVTFAMYLSIVAWLYAIGSLIALARDTTFRRVFVENRFGRAVRRLDEPFYIVCGYGDAGAVVVQALTSHAFSAVVLERDQNRINEHTLEDLARPVQALAADASLPANLLLAGLRHRHCAGVIALTDSDQCNLQIAISAKLLNPRGSVICRAQLHDTQANMESFDTDRVINPFDSFAELLGLALHSPDTHQLYQWLTAPAGSPLPARIDPPRGTWVLCGFGRFGKALAHYLKREGLDIVIIEANPEGTQAPSDTIHGRGTEAVTLQQAGIERAVGIVAGTDDDANNLSIIVTARALNPKLFTVARQNRRTNDPIFEAAKPDLVMQRSRAIAQRIVAYVSTPLLAEFLRHAQRQNNDWAHHLLARLRPLLGQRVPEVWTIDVTESGAPAVHAAMAAGEDVRLGHLLTDPRERTERLAAMALLLRRNSTERMLPTDETKLDPGDRILFCGLPRAPGTMSWALFDAQVLRYIREGEQGPQGFVWRWWRGMR
jgi:voltage-gated potassium channel